MDEAKKPISKKWWILGLGVPPLVWADLYTKVLVVRHLHPYERVPVIGGFFDIFHTRNTGAAFSLFRDIHPEWSLPFFTFVAIVAVGVLGYLFLHIKTYETYLAVTVTLIFSGAIGNFTDRVRFGYVVDFLDFYWRQYHWPIFNVADICISTGATMLIVYSIFLEPKERRENPDKPTESLEARAEAPVQEPTEADTAHAS